MLLRENIFIMSVPTNHKLMLEALVTNYKLPESDTTKSISSLDGYETSNQQTYLFDK